MNTQQQIINALVSLTPGAQWSLLYNADSTWVLTWLDKVQAQPTNAAVLAQIAAQGA